MSFWESKLGAFLGVLLGAWILAICVVGVRVHLATHPGRQTGDDIDFQSMRVPVEPVSFQAVDGMTLAGWRIDADPAAPTVLLCHDLAQNKASLVGLGIDLHRRGFNVLMFDFRGHGESDGDTSTMGLHEKRDILGAVDFVSAGRRVDSGSLGIYGVGMGAHAAVLAAEDRPSLRVLVLDGLYPDASYPLTRSVFAGWQPGIRRLSFLPKGIFALMNGARIGDNRAAETLPRLLGRDMLLLAPGDDPWLTAEIQRMVETIPDQRNVDGNMIVLPATQVDGLYGQHMDRHREQVAEFFESRLGRGRTAPADAG